ncbi:MAG TPA: leucyl aminopeptidase [Gammaproteobacteria bacterium]|nr:leucyl aminopeptidase [Gammaproteobacteria bacterium]
MEYVVKVAGTDRHPAQCLVIPVFEGRRLAAPVKRLFGDDADRLLHVLRKSGFEGKLGQTLLLFQAAGTPADWVLFAGCGPEKEFAPRALRRIAARTARALDEAGIRDAVNLLPLVETGEIDVYWRVRHAVEAIEDTLYRFDQCKSRAQEESKPALRTMIFAVADRRALEPASRGLRHAEAIAAGMRLARDLGNLPGNICTPTYLAQQARRLAREHAELRCTVLDEPEIRRLGMGAFLSVAKGSRQPPKFIILEYRGGRRVAPVDVLIGKGLTFDAGGISIKPAAQMDEMKFDMCGGAAVLGTFKALAMLELPVNVVGLVPACENLPDGNANKPGDIVTSMSGQTIEILNTDAEGRLLICDALTYAERYKPEAVIDIATLTGACVVALGTHATGLLANDQALADALRTAGEKTGDRVWQLPLWEEYQDQLKSNFADMANVGGRDAGTITAACFLSRFAKKLRWAHLDIAGTAWKTGGEKGATGRPVPLLVQHMLDKC